MPKAFKPSRFASVDEGARRSAASTIRAMEQTVSTHLWIGTFAKRLLQLQPGLSPASAINCAVENYHRRHELEPERVAERSAQAEWTTRPGELSSAHAESPSARYQQMFTAGD